MLERTLPSRVAGTAAGAGAALAVAAGVAHGLGRDDETMYGATHIAVGHLLPAGTAALTAVWLTALAAPHLQRLRELVWLSVAQVGLALWACATVLESLGLYVLARTDPTGAAHHARPALASGLFALSAISVLVGLVGALVLASRRGDVAGWAVPFVVIGTLGAFLAGPPGDALLAVGLTVSAVRCLRAASDVVLPVPATA